MIDLLPIINSPLFVGVASAAAATYVGVRLLGQRVKALEDRLEDYDRGPNSVLSRLARVEPRRHH